MRLDITAKLRERHADMAAYRRTFETPDGKRVLRHLMREGFVKKSTFVRRDSHETALNEGARRLVLSIMRFASLDDAAIDEELHKQHE